MKYDYLEKLLEPVSFDSICGIDLDESGELYILEEMVKGKLETQFSEAEPADWKAIIEFTKETFGKSKDLWLAIYLNIGLTIVDGVAGSAHGIDFIYNLLEKYWGSIYPLIDEEDEEDEEKFRERLSPLETLFNERGLFVKTIKNIKLSKVKFAENLSYLELDKLQADRKNKEIENFYLAVKDSDSEFKEVLINSFKTILDTCENINEFIDDKVGSERNITNITKFIELVKTILTHLNKGMISKLDDTELVESDEERLVNAEVSATRINTKSNAASVIINSSQDINHLLQNMKKWYEKNEPSSPIPFMLRRIESLVDKNFIEIMNDIAAESVGKIGTLFGNTNQEFLLGRRSEGSVDRNSQEYQNNNVDMYEDDDDLL